MRIIAGTHRGTVLADVGQGDAAAHLRPTSDRVREALFSVLTHMNVVQGARVLDLFAGTGAMGLEALSRGAHEVCFVEKGRVGQKLISSNIDKMRVEDRTQIIRGDATALGAWPAAAFDLVFLDPPYGKGMGAKALTTALAGGWLAQGALIVWEENAVMMPPKGVTREGKRKYGDTHVTLMRVG